MHQAETENGTWGTSEEDPFGKLATQLGELVGVLQVLHHFLQLSLGLRAPLHVLKGLLILFGHVLLHAHQTGFSWTKEVGGGGGEGGEDVEAQRSNQGSWACFICLKSTTPCVRSDRPLPALWGFVVVMAVNQ